MHTNDHHLRKCELKHGRRHAFTLVIRSHKCTITPIVIQGRLDVMYHTFSVGYANTEYRTHKFRAKALINKLRGATELPEERSTPWNMEI